MIFFRKGFIQSAVIYPTSLVLFAAYFSFDQINFTKKNHSKPYDIPPIVNLLFDHQFISISGNFQKKDLAKSQTFNTYSGLPDSNNFFLNQEVSLNKVKISSKILRISKNEKIFFKIHGSLNHFLKFHAFHNLFDLSMDINSKSYDLKFSLNGKYISTEKKITSNSETNLLAIENSGKEIFITDLILEGAIIKEKPNVFFIVIDSLRADALGVFGSKFGATPNLDKFAMISNYFSNHSVNSSWTRPSTMIFFTGSYPSNTFINFWDYPVFASEKKSFYDSEITPLPALFSTEGYKSIMIGNNPFITDHRYLGVDTGFEKVFDFASVENDTIPITEKAISYIKNNKTKTDHRSLFLFLNYNDPHRPYTPPEKYLNQIYLPTNEDPRKKNYLGEVLFVDSEIGRFFEFLQKENLFENSVIIVSSDHGEVMDRVHSVSKFTGIYTLFGHGQGLYEEDIQTPLFIKLPNQSIGKKVSISVRSIDIFPTLVDILGLKPHHKTDGKSLIPVISGLEKEDREYYGEGRGVVAYRKNGFKQQQKTYLFHRPGFSWDGKVGDEPAFLYNLKNDPNEHTPILHPEVSKEFSHIIDSKRSKETFYEFRLTHPDVKHGSKLSIDIYSKLGKPKVVPKTLNFFPDRIDESASSLRIEKTILSDEAIGFQFKIYPDINPPEFSIRIDNKLLPKEEFGVGEMSVYPGSCKISDDKCAPLFFAKNRAPEIPEKFKIQIWRSGKNITFAQKHGILENEAMNILKKQGYVK